MEFPLARGQAPPRRLAGKTIGKLPVLANPVNSHVDDGVSEKICAGAIQRDVQHSAIQTAGEAARRVPVESGYSELLYRNRNAAIASWVLAA